MKKIKNHFVLIVFTVFLFLVFGILVSIIYVSNRKEKDVARLDSILALSEESGFVGFSDDQVNELNDLRKSVGGYVRNTSAFLLAEEAYRRGKLSEALEIYQTLVRKSGYYMSAKASLNTAYILLTLGSKDEAVLALNHFLSKRNGTIVLDFQLEAEILLAYLLEENDLPKALDIYQNVVTTQEGENIWYIVAQSRLIYFNKI